MKNIACFAIQLPMVLVATVRTRNTSMVAAPISAFFAVQQPPARAVAALMENIKNSLLVRLYIRNVGAGETADALYQSAAG
jgi:hypothetical protein